MRFVLAFLAAAALVFAAASEHHSLNLAQSYMVSGKTLQPGHYTVVIDGDQASIMQNSRSVLEDITVETSSTKYHSTRTMSSGNTMSGSAAKLTEIDLGGTHKKLIFN